jgi:hypothetical protein
VLIVSVVPRGAAAGEHVVAATAAGRQRGRALR